MITPYPITNGLLWCIICDIDGTLALMGDRSPYNWNEVWKDSINKPVQTVLYHLSGRYEIILLSGRDSVCREDTEEWLKKYDVSYKHLYMRAEGDSRKDTEIKQELFDKYIKDKYNVAFVIDDRPCMTKHWKEQGLFVFDVYQDPDRTNF